MGGEALHLQKDSLPDGRGSLGSPTPVQKGTARLRRIFDLRRITNPILRHKDILTVILDGFEIQLVADWLHDGMAFILGECRTVELGGWA